MSDRRPPGTGSIYQASDGVWWAAIYVGQRRVRRRRYTREDAELALAEMIQTHRDEVGWMYHLARTGQATRPARPGSRRHLPRHGVTLQVRFAVLQRDGFRCSYCGATSQTAQLVVDHVVPIAAGGSDEMINLTTACIACNHGKAGRRLDVLPGGLTG